MIVLKSSTDIEDYLHSRDDYYNVYDYKSVNLPLIKIVKLYVGVDKTVMKGMIKFDGDETERLNSCIDELSKIAYNYNQSDPNAIYNKGGNCQALSIYFKNLCDLNDIECKLDGTDTHEFCVVEVEGFKYVVDIANKIVKEEE